jgi:possible RNA-binding protein
VSDQIQENVMDQDIPETHEELNTQDAQDSAHAASHKESLSTLPLAEGELASDKVADLVEYIVCGLVTNKEAVALDVTDSNGAALIEISCAEEDAGRIIGRKGRTIKAIRTLARALGSRVNTAVEVEVLG